jgi:predicted nucleotidyltransferase
MRSVDSLDAINMPVDYKTYLAKYLHNISDVPFISRVMLFGSCARENTHKYSDIDIFITTNREITEAEETLIAYDCLPEYSMETIPTDIIVQSESDFRKYINSFGMVQKQVNREGVNISGLLHQCTGN